MEKVAKTVKPGYLYVLTHPSAPDLYKIGQTTRQPEERLAEHNCRSEEYTGQVVKETGQKWELKTYVAVPDVFWAEVVFWGSTWQADIPFRRGIEIEKMTWKEVETALAAAKKAGVRPPPGPLPDWVYAYDAWMKNRLKGRGIELVGHVKSRHGKSDFRCSTGHKWRTVPNIVAEGAGCPQCGVGETTPDEAREAAGEGVLFLLTHPERSGFIRVGLTLRTLEQSFEENPWGEWQVHRYRNVDFPDLAVRLIWELLGCDQPKGDEPIKLDLKIAEQAFRDLIYRMQSEIALSEQARENSRS